MVVAFMVIIRLIAGTSRVDQLVLLHCLLQLHIRVDFRESLLVDGFGGLFLLHRAETAIIQMLVEILWVAENDRAFGTLASRIGGRACSIPSSSGARVLLSAVRGCLFHSVHRDQVTLEDICSVEALLGGRSGSRAESTHHCSFVVSECVTVLVILAGEPFDVPLAVDKGAFLRSL